MPRAGRSVKDDGIYHILNRGHNKRKLFSSVQDFKEFKDILARYKEKIEFDLYHYCLMPNHFHLLLKIRKGDKLKLLMKGISQTYSFHYKRCYGLSGYLFQNRYKNIPITKDEYLMECGRYIERNPVRAGLVDNLNAYCWSSYHFYAKGKADGIITPDPLFLALSSIEQERRAKYIEYVATPRPYEELLDEKISELK
ncbi:MAG: transposase [Candidatus Omnitrophica bacterium]|nr:transposase [Candidatus Omnitrophota bacterium]MBU0881330.1 transposase [Candidatus Omnitrophota bacterium]MBU1037440.1 transposase [Candidatus Omnitrophota bacterium]MBU1809161.1 transposase [Candidatus Omnitrophota bacterium]